MGAVTEEQRARFDALWEAHYAPVLAYARRRCRDAAADVAADAFLVAWRRLDDVPAGDPLPWLIGVARRCVANHRRGEKRRGALLRRLGGLAAEVAPDPADLGGSAELREAFAALRPADREILALASWEGLSARGIAAVLQCREGTAAVRLHRARARLREALEADRGPTRGDPVGEAEG
jgi:RNA polymerase sigma-70 factor (ECF subfamily)